MRRANLLLPDMVTHAVNIGDIVRDPILILDMKLRVISANPAFYKLFRTTADQTENRLLHELGNSQWNIPELITLLKASASKGRGIDGYDVCHDFPGIGRRTMRLKARKLTNPGSRGGVLVLSIEDISEPEQVSSAISISETRYRRLFEAARDGILILDSEHGKITDANPFMTELLGYSKDELLGKRLWEIGLLKDQKASRDAFGKLKKDGTLRYEDLPLESRRSEQREVEFVSNLYEEGDETVIQCNIRDITARKKLESDLAVAHRQNEKIAITLQRTMLFQPKESAFSGLSVHTVYSTASDEALVGGDFWDTFAFDDGHVALVCGDVMGHGLFSAVFTTELKHALRAYTREHVLPSRIMYEMNEYLTQSNRLFNEGINTEGNDNPVCLSIAIIDRLSGETSLASAAMEWPLLVRANGETQVLEATGPPLGIGIGPKPRYNHVEFQLGLGDTLIMTTDGITEARHGKEFLGGDGLARLATESRQGTLKEMGNSILKGATEFAGGTLRDDACLVLVRKE